MTQTSNFNFGDDSLWVLNLQSVRQTIEVTTANGKEAIVLPKTWVPIDLTWQFSKSDIMQSSHFRKALVQEIIKIIPGDKAEAILSKRDAREALMAIIGAKTKFALDAEEKTVHEIADLNVKADSSNILITKVFSQISEDNMINELRVLFNSGKINKKDLLPVGKRAKEENKDSLFKVVMELAED